MIEKKFVAEKMKEFLVEEYMATKIGRGKYSKFEIKKTPLGEKVIVYTAKPGLIVGKKGENIKAMTRVLKTKFKMENPQVEVSEVRNPDLDAQSVADAIVNTLERFGPKRFKSTGYRTLQRVIDSGALGAEIRISGRGLPGSRAKSWRFYAGYMKKSGDVAVTQVLKGASVANLKSGTIGINVMIMPLGTVLPDKIDIEIPKEMPVKEKEIEIKELGEKAEIAEKEELESDEAELKGTDEVAGEKNPEKELEEAAETEEAVEKVKAEKKAVKKKISKKKAPKKEEKE